MNLFDTYATRLGLAAVVTASAAALLGPDAIGQSVTLNGVANNTCTYSAMAVQPNGTVTVTCATANPVPACTISGASQVNTGATATLTANCTNSPTLGSYVWAISPTPAGGFTNPGTQTLSGSLPDGTYNFTVTAANSNGTGPTSTPFSLTFGTPAVAPTCAFVTAASPINVGDNSQFSATCTGASTYAWTAISVPVGAAAPTAAATSGPLVGPFGTAGTYTYRLVASNAVGPSPNYDVNVVVNSVGGGGGSCPTVATVASSKGNDLINLRYDLKPGQVGSTGFDWPYQGKTQLRFFTIKATNLESPAGLSHTVTISPCQGQIILPAGTSPNACTYTGGNGGGTFMVGDGTGCVLTPGTRYYVNVKQVNTSNVNTCVPNTAYGITYCSTVTQAQ